MLNARRCKSISLLIYDIKHHTLPAQRMRLAAIDIGRKNFALAYSPCQTDDGWCVINMVDVKDLTLDGPDLYRNLITHLNKFRKIWEDVDVVLIEQQLNRMNVQATKLSCHVHAYFLNQFPSKRVFEYPPTYKTRLLKEKSVPYRERKNFAVRTVLDYYEHADPVLHDWIMTLPKKDDVADCILMCKTFFLSPLYRQI